MSNNPSEWSAVMQKLQEPFLPDEIEWRVGSTTQDKTKGMALAYVTNRAIQNRLDDIFGPFGWRNEYREWKATSQLCGISVRHDGEWITKWDGAEDSDMESVKGGLSDAMKRAAYQWGIGRYLYKLEAVWMPIEQRGRSSVLKGTPNLPAWALPAGYGAKPQAPQKPDKPPTKPTVPVDRNKASDGQISAIVALAKETGMVSGMKPLMQERYKKDSSGELNKDEAKDLLNYLREVKGSGESS